MTVRFEFLADTLDNAMAWARRDFLLVNGTNVFLYPEGRSLDFPATVSVHTEPGWRVATGLDARRGRRAPTRAGNYHDLVDMPFFIGRFDLDSAQVAGKWIAPGVLSGRHAVRRRPRTQFWSELPEHAPRRGARLRRDAVERPTPSC